MKKPTKYRVLIQENSTTSEYVLNEVILSNKTPRQIVQQYIKLYPNVYSIEAKEDNPWSTKRCKTSTGLRA